MDHNYDSESESVELAPTKKDQRRIIDQDSATNTDESSSLSSSLSSNNSQLHSRRRRINRKGVTSSESEEICFETASIDSTLPSNPILIENFHQNLNLQQQRPTKTTHRLENERRDIMTNSTSATTIINHYSSEGESSSTLLEQWKVNRMRRRNNMINRMEANMGRGTHQVTTDSQSVEGHIPTTIDVIQPSARISTTIHLIPIKTKAIETQDKIGWDHFIRGRTASEFAPVIQKYYINNKIRPFSASLRWSVAINKYNFFLHQSAWKNYCSERASPVRAKNKISQRKHYLLLLVEKYYSQAADLPKLLSQ